MLAVKNCHDRDKCISFEDIGHKYTINGDCDYISVTTLTHGLFSEFNAQLVIKGMMSRSNWPSSQYYGMTETEIMSLWDDNRKESAEKGTMLHKMIEDYYNDLDVDYENMDEFVYFIQFDSEECIEPYRTEWMIWDDVFKIAGSIDMISKNSDGTFSIYDWKRSKKINMTAFNNKCSEIHGLTHIPDTNYWHYTIQLNIYKYILETNYDIVIRDMFIVQIHPNMDKFNKIRINAITEDIDKIMLRRGYDLNKV